MRGDVKMEGKARGFQHLRDLAKVNDLKNTDCYYYINSTIYSLKYTKGMALYFVNRRFEVFINICVPGRSHI